MPICEVIGFRVNVGALKLFPVVGSEIPVQTQGINTQVELTRKIDSGDRTHGELARLISSDAVDLYAYWGGVTDEISFRRLVGKQISKDPLTRNHLQWVKERRVSFLSEICQFSDSSL